jgi:hypothetical protein
MKEKEFEILKRIEKQINFIYKVVLLKQKKKSFRKDYTCLKDIDEVFNFYKFYIKKDSRLNSSSKENIRNFIKEFGKEKLIAVMEKKSKSKWFKDNCSWRGASWFFSNKKRFNRWLEEGVEPPKLRPYSKFSGNILSKDCLWVLNDYGNWCRFEGTKDDIEWREVK